MNQLTHKNIICSCCGKPLTQTKTELRCEDHGDQGLTGWHPNVQAVIDWAKGYLESV